MTGEPARISYRACETADIEAVLALWRRAEAVPRPTDHVEGLRLRLQRDNDLFQLAFAGEELVGSLMGGWDGWRGNMYRLVVDPDYRRTGIAEDLVARVESRLRERGAERITSLVFRDEPPAVRFWAAMGYRPDAAIERYAKDLVS